MREYFQTIAGQPEAKLVIGLGDGAWQLSGPRHPTNLDQSRVTAGCTCSKTRENCLDIFLSSVITCFLSHSLFDIY